MASRELVTVKMASRALARILALGGTVVNSLPECRAIRAQTPARCRRAVRHNLWVQFIGQADEVVSREFDTSEGGPWANGYAGPFVVAMHRRRE